MICGLLEQAKDNGEIEVQPGVYLTTQEEALNQQKNWDEFDFYKTFPFGKSPFWIMGGVAPIAVSSDEEVNEELDLTSDLDSDAYMNGGR